MKKHKKKSGGMYLMRTNDACFVKLKPFNCKCLILEADESDFFFFSLAILVRA